MALVVTIGQASRVARSYRSMIELRFENVELVERLRQETGSAESSCSIAAMPSNPGTVNGFANPTESGDAKKAGMVFAASEPGQGRTQPDEANP